MKKKYHSMAAIAVLVSLGCGSCSNAGISDSVSDSKQFTLQTTMSQDNVWTVNMPEATSRADTKDALWYGYYVFKSDGKLLCNGGQSVTAEKIRDGYPASFTALKDVGTYTIYGVINISQTGHPTASKFPNMTTAQTITLTEPSDVCLGSNQVEITASKINYNLNVTVSHIMAKLALTIKNVPADIDSIAVILPQESNVFNFKGEFSGSSQADTLSVKKASAANTDGTYDWSVLSGTDTEVIVFPCTLTSMPVKIIAMDTDYTYTFNTSTSYVCTSGTRTKLSTTWSTMTNVGLNMTVSPWTGTQQSGDFDMGNGSMTNN